ncbi:FAD-dependent oxidoreductase [Bosea caraganae]|uniref:FAD-dependent oxidoreductase n=1 Tax=Bosea caraganae TaxID=2763117 RepID=A0A370LBG5_9HYPH|nr:FAD-dependent oxidoreductase [Bosea caraganae]RDJ21724.1 FAD-dependent oxidoreductase [Bosea caraganae]RDJ28246.1 FAD-dependent oxidoreductase [Bosea caraganae]
MQPDVVVIGGGTVGAAIAYGLAARRQRVLLLDGDDGDFRAARANFGLVWLQGKGMNMPAYQQLTRSSVALWPDFVAELTETTGIGLTYEQNGGLAFCLGEDEFEKRKLQLQRLHNQLAGEDADWEMLDRAALSKLLPKVQWGPEVAGASFGRLDGHVNPLKLLGALHAGLVRRGGAIRSGATVREIRRDGEGLRVSFGNEQVTAPKLVIAAGLGSQALARQVGLDVPVRPQRGQILVTERLAPFLPLPASGLRQTGEGTVMIGATQEEAGYDVSTTGEAAAKLSRKTIRLVPALADVALVRQWAGLRIMTPDSYPIYAQSPSHPGAFVALCHSGVTLAAVHAAGLAEAIAAGSLPASLDPFHQRRFDVPKAA